MGGHRGIQRGQHLRIGHILAATDNRGHHPKINRPTAEHRRNLRQPLAQRDRIVQLPGRPAPAHVVRRRDLGHHIGTPINGPVQPRSLSIAFTVTLLRHRGGIRPYAIAALIRDDTDRWQERRRLNQRVAELEAAAAT